MTLDVAAVQSALRERRPRRLAALRFRGSNPIAARLAGLAARAPCVTRRWYYLIPREGTPRKLVHAIERHNLDPLPGETTIYAGRGALDSGLTTLVDGVHRVAMEYSPECAIPYLSRVDAGTIDTLRKRGVEVVSSGDLVQRFEAAWDEAALATHRDASDAAVSRQGPGARLPARRARGRPTLDEFEVQTEMVAPFADEGLVSDSPPVVAAQENAGNPHYLPTAARHRPSAATKCCCWTSGASSTRPRRSSPTSRGWPSPARGFPSGSQRAWHAVAARGTPPSTFVQTGIRAGRRPARMAGGPGGATRADRRGVRRPHPASHRPQPGRGRARQRRAHGRLRDARRSAADPGDGVHRRAGPVFRRLRPAHRNQHHGGRSRRRP